MTRFGTDILLPVDPDGELPVSPTRDLVLVSEAENVAGALQRRTLTTPGQLLHRPTYGAGVEAELSKPSTPPRRAAIATAVRRNLLDDPRVQDARVTVAPGVPGDTKQPGVVTIGLDARLKDDSAAKTEFVMESL